MRQSHFAFNVCYSTVKYRAPLMSILNRLIDKTGWFFDYLWHRKEQIWGRRKECVWMYIVHWMKSHKRNNEKNKRRLLKSLLSGYWGYKLTAVDGSYLHSQCCQKVWSKSSQIWEKNKRPTSKHFWKSKISTLKVFKRQKYLHQRMKRKRQKQFFCQIFKSSQKSS